MMNIKELLNLFKKNMHVLGATAFLAGAVALSVSLLQPTLYQANATLVLFPSQLQTTKEFAFDRFYILKASEKLTTVITAYLKSPEVVASILKEANLPQAKSNPRALSRYFNIVSRSPQTLNIFFKTQSPGKAQEVLLSLTTRLEEYLKTVQPQQENITNYSFILSEPLITQLRPKAFIIGAAGFLLGLVIAGLFVVAIHQSKNKKPA